MRHQIVLSYGDVKQLLRGEAFLLTLGGEALSLVYERTWPVNSNVALSKRKNRNATGPYRARCKVKSCRQVFHSKTKLGAKQGVNMHYFRVHKRSTKRKGER